MYDATMLVKRFMQRSQPMPTWLELRRQLFLALLDGFSANDLKHMLRYECDNRRLETITSLQHNLGTIIVNVIDNAERRQWVEQLATGASRFNPSNNTIATVASQITQLHGANPQAFYTQVEQAEPFLGTMPSQQIISNSGAVAVGKQSTAIGERGVNITGVNYGNIVTNSAAASGTRSQLDHLFAPLIVELAQKVPSSQLPQALETIKKLKNALCQPDGDQDSEQITRLRDILAKYALKTVEAVLESLAD